MIGVKVDFKLVNDIIISLMDDLRPVKAYNWRQSGFYACQRYNYIVDG
jgi:hypothetical protein